MTASHVRKVAAMLSEPMMTKAEVTQHFNNT